MVLQDTFNVENDILGLEFAEQDGNTTVNALRYKPTGATFAMGDTDPFWELEFRNGAGYAAIIDSNDAATAKRRIESTAEGTTVKLFWERTPLHFADVGEQGSFDMTLRFHLPDEEGLIRVRPRIEIDANKCTLWHVAFPVFGNVRRVGADRGEDRLLLPDGWGAYIRNPVQTDRLRTWNKPTYPSGSTTMQFLTFENDGTGIYLGLHDPQGRPKRFGVETPDDRTLSIRLGHYPDGMGTEQSVFDPGYDAVIGCYEGDWYDAAEIYRKWALTEAVWTDAGPIAERTDIPDWFPEIGLWWAPEFAAVASFNDEAEQSCAISDLHAAADVITEFVGQIDVPMACHWYHWHRIPFDTGYPDYRPARNGFASIVSTLQSNGVRVMPYINARLADPNSRIWNNENLEAATAKRTSARFDPCYRTPDYEVYGNRQLLAPICATTDAWQKTLVEIVNWLETSIGVDAVYLDQIAALNPPLCFDAEHDHSPGGGTYAVSAYRDLLDKLSNMTEIALTTECNAESYMNGVSGHLLWHSWRSESVPLFQTVYGEYAIAFGREFFAADLDGDGTVFRSKLAQLFDYGAQLGWMPLTVAQRLLEPENRAAFKYLERSATALSAGHEYMVTGRRLPDPSPCTSIPAKTVTWDVEHRPRWEVELPVVLASAWHAPVAANAEGIALAITNWTDTERSAAWLLDHGFDVDMGGFKLKELSESTVMAESRTTSDGMVVEVTTPPRSTAIFQVDTE